MSSGRSFLRALVVLLTIGVCTISGSSPTTLDTPGTTADPVGTTTTIPECAAPIIADAALLEANPSRLAIVISQTAFSCSDEVVVVNGGGNDLLAGAQLAAAARAPLLLIDDDPSPANEEIRRLGVDHIYAIGLINTDPQAANEVTRLAALEALDLASDLLGGVPVVTATGAASLGRLGVAALTRNAVVRGSLSDIDGDAAWLSQYAPKSSTVWLGDGTNLEYLAPVLAAAAARGETVLLVDPGDLRRLSQTVTAYRAIDPSSTILAGNIDPQQAGWQLPALVSAPELPGGGLTFFPGRRLVALYGNPTTSALGVLGEQGPDESVNRALLVSEGYDGDGVPILPSFEIIATVASASAGSDNNYSEEMSIDVVRPWVDVAAANGMYVILDLQPGRTDFLTQAKQYEQLLRMPHVGLALDPEWRLEPDQVHLRQIGSVDAAEVNGVVDWLAGIVREENLPQKFFLMHQFRLDMITNRDQVKTPSELAVVVQMDGQGPLSTKYDTWAAIIAGTDDAGFSFGWKNFYDEDTPRGGATAEQVLELDPVPVYVSFQ